MMTLADTVDRIGRRLLVLGAALTLAACSSGSSSDASPNRAPLVDAGQPQLVQGGGVVVLKGAAVDPEGDDVDYLWRQTAGLGVSLSDSNSPITSFEVPSIVNGEELEFELRVTDSARMPATDTTQVLVTTGFKSCAPTPPPSGLNVELLFYQKFCDANGQAVLAPYAVPDLALSWTRYQMLEMLKRLPLAAQEMIRNGSQVTIKAQSQVLTDIPEYADLYSLYPEYDWDALPGVGAVVDRPITSTTEENVLCRDDDPYRGYSVFIHEFAHSIHLIGLRSVDPSFETRLRQAYETAMASGLWADTYSATNHLEYWAEGVAIWFNAHWSSFDHPAVINTREKLAQYDDGLYRLVREHFSEDELPMCPPSAT